jgi:trimeric autotransporter adhesin
MGHGLDSYDTNGTLSSPGECIADIVSTMRLHASCVGRGFFWTLNRGCGMWTCPGNPASTGYNCSQYGDCCVGCTGIRESDYAKHASGNPHTPANFICTLCGGGSGPCGKEVHCENAPGAEAAWDVAARDLEAAPFNLDRQTSFTFADKFAFIGSGSVGQWYTCTCPSTSGGCVATNGYQRYLIADDDDGNLNNGTPHMTAIYAAWNRHALACATPTVQNSGCSGAPTTAPVLTATPVSMGANLSWTAVTGATTYRLYKSVSTLGCDTGKMLLTQTTALSFVDTALDCNSNNYMVQPVGSDTDCLGPTSNCALSPCFNGATSATNNQTTSCGITVAWTAGTSSCSAYPTIKYDIYRSTDPAFVPASTNMIASCVAGTTYLDSTPAYNTTYYYIARAEDNRTGGSGPCNGGWYIDDVSINYGSACTVGSNPPGRVLNNMIVTKSGTNLNLSWTAPGGTCTVTGYGLYRGTLPWTGYNHASIDCTITTTSTTTPQQSGSNYYLIVPLNATNEGSYGTDSAGTQRPQGSSPCKPQNLTVC